MKSIIPYDLVHETLQTLALLLPRTETKCNKWFQKQQDENHGAIDPKAGDVGLNSGGRAQKNFPYWHERLCVLQKAYEQPDPKSLRHFLHDRRNKVQWYTFGIAVLVFVLTIVFGIISFVTGVMQVYAAYHLTPSN